MTETYARSFPCGCFIELDIAYDWVDCRISIEEVTVHKCSYEDYKFCPECKSIVRVDSVYCDGCGSDL